MQHDSPPHTDDAYNRAVLRLYRAAIEAGLRAEAEEAEQSKTTNSKQIGTPDELVASYEGEAAHES